ncbi:MAG: AtuA-related protein, partial [Advenella sp.]
MSKLIKLHEIAHARAGDKGNRLNISLIPYDPVHWP